MAAFLPEHSDAGRDDHLQRQRAHPARNQRSAPSPASAVGDGAGEPISRCTSGPKDIDILRAVNPKLEQVVDFGWFSILAKPLFLIVNWVTDRVIHNYGWSIILVTIAINFVLFPLKITSMKSMKKMQALQPQIAAINDKYKNVGLRDPRKAEQNQEVMELVQEARRESHGRMRAHAAPDSVLHRVLQSVLGVDRDARRELAVGHGSFAAGDAGHPHSADHHDRQPVRDAEDDAHHHGRRSQPAAA